MSRLTENAATSSGCRPVAKITAPELISPVVAMDTTRSPCTVTPSAAMPVLTDPSPREIRDGS